MTADAILYVCNTVAVGLFGIVLSAAFCNIRWTRRNVCCMIASTLAIFLIQGSSIWGSTRRWGRISTPSILIFLWRSPSAC